MTRSDLRHWLTSMVTPSDKLLPVDLLLSISKKRRKSNALYLWRSERDSAASLSFLFLFYYCWCLRKDCNLVVWLAFNCNFLSFVLIVVHYESSAWWVLLRSDPQGLGNSSFTDRSFQFKGFVNMNLCLYCLVLLRFSAFLFPFSFQFLSSLQVDSRKWSWDYGKL